MLNEGCGKGTYMKIKTYKVYTTHSLTAALEMYSELVRRMKKGESLDVRDCQGIKIKVDDVKLLSYKEDGKIRYAVSAIGPLRRAANAEGNAAEAANAECGMLNAE